MPGSQLLVIEDRGVKFINDYLQVWFNLVPDPENDGRNWYAGSATSALLDNREILDPVRADALWLFMCHDREKRCMQIDQIQLYHSGGSEELGKPVQLSDKAYHLVANSERVEPEFVELTVAVPLSEDIDPVTQKKLPPKYELYRAIRLEAEANYLDEKLSIHAAPGAGSVAPWFAVRYYAHIHAGLEGLALLSSAVVHSFAAGVSWGARATYALGCNARIEDLELDSSRVWASVAPCKSLECRHVFAREEEMRKVLHVASLRTSAHRVAHAGSRS